MWKNNMIKIVIVGLFLMSFVFPTTAWSDEKQEHKGPFISRVQSIENMFFDDLTKSEKAKVFKIISQNSEHRRELRIALMNARQELIKQVFSGSSEESLAEAIQNATDAKTDMMILRVNLLREVAAALPPEVADKLRRKVEERLL